MQTQGKDAVKQELSFDKAARPEQSNLGENSNSKSKIQLR